MNRYATAEDAAQGGWNLVESSENSSTSRWDDPERKPGSDLAERVRAGEINTATPRNGQRRTHRGNETTQAISVSRRGSCWRTPTNWPSYAMPRTRTSLLPRRGNDALLQHHSRANAHRRSKTGGGREVIHEGEDHPDVAPATLGCEPVPGTDRLALASVKKDQQVGFRFYGSIVRGQKLAAWSYRSLLPSMLVASRRFRLAVPTRGTSRFKTDARPRAHEMPWYGSGMAHD